MRNICAIVFVWLAASPVFAQSKSPDYYAAEAYFHNNYNLRNRVISQILLISVGLQNSVPSERFQNRIFEGTKEFQRTHGLPSTGILDKATFDRLAAEAVPLLRDWNFRETGHPTRGRPIWIPQGLGLAPVPNKNGLTFRDPAERLQVSYNFFPGTSVEEVYQYTMRELRAKKVYIHFSIIKDGWFVIHSSSEQGVDASRRYHQDGSGILGFTVYWNNDKGRIYGERVAVLMSSSLSSVMTGRPFVEPPDLSQEANKQFAPEPDKRPVAPSPPPPVPSAPSIPADQVSTGSGFFVDDRGHFITNAHVLKNCKTVVVKTMDGQVRAVAAQATDETNDLALVEVRGMSNIKFAPIRYGARLGESIAAFGFPHIDVLSTGGNFTLGNVTALAGIRDDSRYYQMSAPVQQGSSGGPMLDYYGNVVGVVSSKLNVLKVAELSGDFPQNINFAIKGSILASFLESNRVSVTAGNSAGQKLDPADLAEAARSFSALVVCQ